MGKAICVARDRAGNKLYRKVIKSRGTVQYSARNKQGKLVKRAGALTLMRRVGLLKR